MLQPFAAALSSETPCIATIGAESNGVAVMSSNTLFDVITYGNTIMS